MSAVGAEKPYGEHMPDPSYRPRDYLVFPRKFGLVDEPELREQTSFEDQARSRAAAWQCRHASTVRRLLIERDVTRKRLAEVTGIRYQRLTRLLTGEVVMRVEDLMRLRLFFEVHATSRSHAEEISEYA